MFFNGQLMVDGQFMAEERKRSAPRNIPMDGENWADLKKKSAKLGTGMVECLTGCHLPGQGANIQ